MKKIYNIIALLILSFYMGACNSSSSFDDSNNSNGQVVNAGVEVLLKTGSTIKSLDLNTRLIFRHEINGDKKYVKVVSGSIQIIN